MNTGSFLVDFYIWINPITGYLAIANIVSMFGLAIVAIIKHSDLNELVAYDEVNGHDNWQIPLIILFVLAAIALATYLSPYVFAGGLGWSTFIAPVAFYMGELFIINDYRKTLARHIWKSWYWRFVVGGESLVTLTLISSILFLILSKVTQY